MSLDGNYNIVNISKKVCVLNKTLLIRFDMDTCHRKYQYRGTYQIPSTVSTTRTVPSTFTVCCDMAKPVQSIFSGKFQILIIFCWGTKRNMHHSTSLGTLLNRF